MENKNMETVKKTLLLVFVLTSVVLVLLIWAQGFSDSGTSGSGSFQRSGDESSPIFSSPTQQLPNIPSGREVSTPGDILQTPAPTAPQAQATTPTPTLSQEEIQILMTAETDQ
jgi:hypothetical protein